MHRFVTFCIKIGIALLVLVAISNTAYAATTTETADSNSTMTLGTIDSGSYTDTHQDNEVYQNLKETVDSHLDCYYNLSTSINESRISAFEIGVNAKLTYTGKPDSVAVYIWDDLSGSWDITTITGIDSTETTYSDTTTMSTEHIRDSDGNIAIRFNDTSGNKQNTFNLDYLYVNLTYTNISNVETDKLTYKNGETIITTWTSADGFSSGESDINVEYWDVTAGTQFDLTSHVTSTTSSTSKALTSSEVGHEIDVYVYTTSSATGDNSTAITQGDPWPYSIPNAVGPTSWNSYNDSAYNYQDDTFSGDEHTVYMHGTGFTATHPYRVAYYDAAVENNHIVTDAVNSNAYGNLSSDCVFTSYPADPGTWHAIVCESTKDPPSTYNSSWEYKIADDSFTVEPSAIPEFPTVIAAIAVCLLCAVAYVVMRRKEGKR